MAPPSRLAKLKWFLNFSLSQDGTLKFEGQTEFCKPKKLQVFTKYQVTMKGQLSKLIGSDLSLLRFKKTFPFYLPIQIYESLSFEF